MVEATAVVRLENIIYHIDKKENIEEVEQTHGSGSLLDNLEQSNKTSILNLPSQEFVEALSRINIIRNISVDIFSLHVFSDGHVTISHDHYGSLVGDIINICM